jgi:GNAT superfamily N-acetyltransferase
MLKDKYEKCLYLWADLQHYGPFSMDTETYIQINTEQLITSIMLKYHNGLNLFVPKIENCNFNELNNFINKINPEIISCTKEISANIHFHNSNTITGYISKLRRKQEITHIGVKPTDQQIRKVAEMLCADEHYGAGFNVEELYNQFIKRSKDNFSRDIVILSKTNAVIAHACTGAECKEFAVINGVVTKEEFRHRGYGFSIVSELCGILQQENKDIYLVHFTEEAGKIYKKIGFIDVEEWAKISKI